MRFEHEHDDEHEHEPLVAASPRYASVVNSSLLKHRATLCSVSTRATMPLHPMALFSPPEKRYAGYIFDCDGTLADSMPTHYRAWADTVEMHGGHFPEDLFYSLGGVPSVKIVEILNDEFGTNLEPELIATEKELLYVERIAETRPIIDVADFAREVAFRAKVSVASGGILPVVTQTLDVIGLKDFFPVIVTSEQVKRGKPFPDIFLEAARRMQVAPSDCLVLEDSKAGFEAATAAGMDFAVVGRR